MSSDQTPDPVDVQIGARVRKLREGRNFTQAQLASAIGVTFQQVQKYERGVNRIAAARLMRIAIYLGCAPQDLMGSPATQTQQSAMDVLASTPDGCALAAAYNTMSPDRRRTLLAVAHDLLSASATEARKSA